ALGDLDGLVCERRRLLPLFILGRAGLRSHRSRRHLCSRLSADCRGAALRDPAAAEQDLAHQHDRPLMAMNPDALAAALSAALGDATHGVTIALGQVSAVVPHDRLLAALRTLRDRPELRFELLV